VTGRTVTHLIRSEKLGGLGLGQANRSRLTSERCTIAQVTAPLEVKLKELLNKCTLQSSATLARRPFQEAMRVDGVGDLATVVEIDALYLTDLDHARKHRRDVGFSKLGFVPRHLVNPSNRESRVELERMPADGVLQARDCSEGFLQTTLSNEAPRAYCVRDYVYCNCARSSSSSRRHLTQAIETPTRNICR
jgi:hypothetical protein